MNRPTVAEWGLHLARVTAERATCLRRSVGCVLLDHRGRILATGYNGVARGMPHCNEVTGQIEGDHTYRHACSGANSSSGTNLDGCEAIHAEQNAVAYLVDPDRVFFCCCTTSPCITCVKILLNTECQEIHFYEAYPHVAARELWERAGRRWEHHREGL